jgi:thymidylate kinase
MIIFFCGVDCSGKDSLRHELAKLYNYEIYMSPRSPICNIVYDNIYGRNNTTRKLSNINLIGSFLELGAYFVHVKVDPDILHQRAIARNEKHISSVEDFKKHIEQYQATIEEIKTIHHRKYKYRFIEIDNSSDLLETTQKLKTNLDTRRIYHCETPVDTSYNARIEENKHD